MPIRTSYKEKGAADTLAAIYQPPQPPKTSIGDFLDIILAVASFVPAGSGALQAALTAANLVDGQTTVNGGVPLSPSVQQALNDPTLVLATKDALVNTGKAAADAVSKVSAFHTGSC